MPLFQQAVFLTTVANLRDVPMDSVCEVAFAGRSNAGKSSAINTLAGRTRLAYVSKTPGRTQCINLVALGKQGVTDAVLADLPGYGYAAVPREAKLRWQRVMGNYLITRPNLKAGVLMCDPRLGLTELDEILLDVIRPRVAEGLKFLILLTKADKLSHAEAQKALGAKFDPRAFLKAAIVAARDICSLRFEAFGCAGQASRIKPISMEKMAAAYR